MKHWQMLTWMEPEQMLDIARHADHLGFEGVMLGDHGIYPRDIAADYPYSGDGRPPMHHSDPYPDCWSSIGAMAAVTENLRFSVSVYVLPLRNVFEVARATGTLDILSKGRVDIGVGVGWMKEEFELYGEDFHRRGKRCDEMLTVLRQFWQGGLVEFHGEELDFPACEIAPAPGRQLRVLVGGASPAALARAARHDGWIGTGNDPDEVPEILRQLHALRERQERLHPPFETIIGLTRPASAQQLADLESGGMTSAVNAPFRFLPGDTASVDAKKHAMERYAKDHNL